ncbi:hypothetical protein [Helicobacter fennelliae]|uniref:hypothetical protein n=1 Tax=Helicobacter fennelliae TaxID=215 RepID=UPI0011BD4840|nr:hypothetical protein [Helicobacter fennelliae]
MANVIFMRGVKLSIFSCILKSNGIFISSLQKQNLSFTKITMSLKCNIALFNFNPITQSILCNAAKISGALSMDLPNR